MVYYFPVASIDYYYNDEKFNTIKSNRSQRKKPTEKYKNHQYRIKGSKIQTTPLKALRLANCYSLTTLNLDLFGDLALKPGEKPPEPTVPTPKEASEKEKENAIEITLQNMEKKQVNNSARTFSF